MSDTLDDDETQMVSWPQEETSDSWSDMEEQRFAVNSVNADDLTSQDLFSEIASNRRMDSAVQENNEEHFSSMDDILLSENMVPCFVNLRPISPEKTPENWTVPRFNFLSSSTQGRATPKSRGNFVYPAVNSLESQLHFDVQALAAKYSQQTSTSCGITQSQQAAKGRKVTQSQQLTVDPLQLVHSSHTTDDETQFSDELEYISSDATTVQSKGSSPKKVTAACKTDTTVSASIKRKFKFVRNKGCASQSGEQQQEGRKVTSLQDDTTDDSGVHQQDGKTELALSNTQVIPASYDITENPETQFLLDSQKPDSVDMRMISQELDALTDLSSQDILCDKNSTVISDTGLLSESDVRLVGTPEMNCDINTVSTQDNNVKDDKLVISQSAALVSQGKTTATTVSDAAAKIKSPKCTKENINEHVLALLEFLDQPVSVTPASAVSLPTPEPATVIKTNKKKRQKKTTPKQTKNSLTSSRKRKRLHTETTPGCRKSPRLINNLSKKVEQVCDENVALNVESEKDLFTSDTNKNRNLHPQKINKHLLGEISVNKQVLGEISVNKQVLGEISMNKQVLGEISMNKTLKGKKPEKRKQVSVERKTLDEFDSEKLEIRMEEMIRKDKQGEASLGETTNPKTTRGSTGEKRLRNLSDYFICDEVDQQEKENCVLVDKQNSVSLDCALSGTEKTEVSTNCEQSKETTPSNRKKKSSPKWLSKYSTSRNSKKGAANKEKTIPQAVAVVNLFRHSYGKSRVVVNSPPTVCTEDMSVFDFVASQDSPVKPKKSKRKPRESKCKKKPPSLHCKVKSPKRDLAAINSDWGIGVNDLDKGDKSEESSTAAVLSQMRKHLEEVERSPLFVESVSPQKKRHCRFVDEKVKSAEKLSPPASDDDKLEFVDKQSLFDTCFSDIDIKPRSKELEESMTEYTAQHADTEEYTAQHTGTEVTNYKTAQNTEVIISVAEAATSKTVRDTDQAQHAEDMRQSRAAQRLRICKSSNSSKSSKPATSFLTVQCSELTELSNTAQPIKSCNTTQTSKTGTFVNATNISPSPLIRPRRRSLRATLDISESTELAEPSPLCQVRQRRRCQLVSSDSEASVATDKSKHVTRTEVGRIAEKRDIQTSSIREVAKREIDITVRTNLHHAESSLVFCCSGLSKSDRLRVSQCCKLIGAKFLQDFTSEVTHLIAAVNEENLCARTVKFTLAVLHRCWVVTPLWIDVCTEYGKRVDEELFQVPGCTVSSNVNVTSLSRSTKLNKKPNLLEGCEVFLRGEFISPSPSRHDLERLLRTGGAKILRREPKSCIETRPYYARQGTALYKTGTIILCMEEKPFHTFKGAVYATPTWLLDCIAQYKLLDVNPEPKKKYKLYK